MSIYDSIRQPVMAQQISFLEPPSPESIDTNDQVPETLAIQIESKAISLLRLHIEIHNGQVDFINKAETVLKDGQLGTPQAKELWRLIKMRDIQINEALSTYKTLSETAMTLARLHLKDCKYCSTDMGFLCQEVDVTMIYDPCEIVVVRIAQAKTNVELVMGFVLEYLEATRKQKCEFRDVDEEANGGTEDVVIDLEGRQDLISDYLLF